MATRPLLAVLFLSLSLMLGGCESRHVHHISRERFKALPRGTEVKLYLNEVQRPHIRLAYVDSFADAETDTETKRRQLKDLQERARRLGGEAVMDVRPLKEELRGMIPDETTPFPSPTQGESERFFFRGVAIRFVPEEVLEKERAENREKTTEQKPPRKPRRGPETDSLDPPMPSDQISEFQRGLGPVVR